MEPTQELQRRQVLNRVFIADNLNAYIGSEKVTIAHLIDLDDKGVIDFIEEFAEACGKSKAYMLDVCKVTRPELEAIERNLSNEI